MSTSTIDTVVVRWRGGEEVDHCLESLLADGGPRLHQVVLVDSGSGDGGARRLAAAFPAVKVIALSENRSFAWAAGQGVAATAGSPYLLLLNPDTVVTPGSLETLADFLDQHRQAAGAVPRLTGLDGTSQHRWQLRRLPSRLRLAAGLPGAPAFASGEVLRIPVEVEQPAAAAWLLRRSLWQALGGLDPGYAPAWWEDVDLCARLAQALREHSLPAHSGFWLVPDAVIRHLGGSSLAELDDGTFLAAFHRNLLRYTERRHPDQLRLIRAGLRLSLLVRALLRPGRRRAYLQTLANL